MDFDEENVAEIRRDRDFKSMNVTARLLDTKAPFAAQISGNSRFDVAIFLGSPALTSEENRTMLTDVRTMMKPNGWLVAKDSCSTANM